MSDQNLQIGINSFNVIVAPMLRALRVFAPPDLPELNQIAMQPTITPMMVQRTATSGREGEVNFEFRSYFSRMVPWKMDGPRQPQRAGFGGTVQLKGFFVEATEELDAFQLFPFTSPAPTAQEAQMAFTVQQVVAAFNLARVNGVPDQILNPMYANTLTAWDGKKLIAVDHDKSDGEGSFSNDLVGGVQTAFTKLAPVPTRAIVAEPTVSELYEELAHITSHFSLNRIRLYDTQKVNEFNKLLIFCRDGNTLERFIELKNLARAKFITDESSEDDPNRFFGNLVLHFDTRPTSAFEGGASFFDYWVMPMLEEQPMETDLVPVNPMGIPVWNPTPRALVYSLVRPANTIDTNYNAWENPSVAQVGIWEHRMSGAGFPEEVLKFRPAQP